MRDFYFGGDNLTIVKVKEGEEKELKRVERKRSSRVRGKVTAASNKWGKETKFFITFCASKWKNNTSMFLKLIESIIRRAEMDKIMEKAKAMRPLTSQAQEEKLVMFETLDNVPDEMII